MVIGCFVFTSINRAQSLVTKNALQSRSLAMAELIKCCALRFSFRVTVGLLVLLCINRVNLLVAFCTCHSLL